MLDDDESQILRYQNYQKTLLKSWKKEKQLDQNFLIFKMSFELKNFFFNFDKISFLIKTLF